MHKNRANKKREQKGITLIKNWARQKALTKRAKQFGTFVVKRRDCAIFLSLLLKTNNCNSVKLLLSCLINIGKSGAKSYKGVQIISKLLISSFNQDYIYHEQILKNSSNEQMIKYFYIQDYNHYFSNIQFYSKINIDNILECFKV